MARQQKSDAARRSSLAGSELMLFKNADRNVIASDPHGVTAESIHVLRGRVQSQHIQAGRRALAICGPTSEVGCTFIAVNLAVALAQIGVKTLLVDGNLRLPAVHTYFEPELTGGGLYECLVSPGEPVTEFIHEGVFRNLDVMSAGRPPRTAHGLLSGESFPELVNMFMRDYDIVIIDTPPANGSVDALRISTVAGFSLIVTRKSRTLVSDTKVLINLLNEERVTTIGTVLNSY